MNNKGQSTNKLRFILIIVLILAFAAGYFASTLIGVKRSEYDSLLLYYEALSQKTTKLEEDLSTIKNSENSNNISFEADIITEDSVIVDESSEFVFISKSGKKYHKENCSSLKDNSEKITLKQAKEIGKEPCKICHK